MSGAADLSITVAGRKIARGQPAFIVAEIGTSHRGDPVRAAELIAAAAEAGADCVKSQYVIADELVHHRMGSIPLPGGDIPLYERFREIERPLEFYAGMQQECARRGVVFLCAAFGVGSARRLKDLDLPAFKVASPELNHTPMLEELAGYRRPLLVSTGVSRLSDIEYALKVTGCPTALLQCVTQYPAAPEDYNLRVLRPLSDLFGCPVGISDHSLDPVAVPLVSLQAGGCAVEKHFTLSRADGGLDDPIAVDPGDFRRMCTALREAERERDAHGPAGLAQYVKGLLGAQQVESILGSPEKRLVAREEDIYLTTNRSLIFVRDVPAGSVLAADQLAPLRAERNLSPGLHPRYLATVVGARLMRSAASGDGLTWRHLLQGL